MDIVTRHLEVTDTLQNDDDIEWMCHMESASGLCGCCQAVFHTGIASTKPCPLGSIRVAHHWTPQSLVAAIESGCVLCCGNFDIPSIRPVLQEALRKSDIFGPGKKPVTVFRFGAHRGPPGFADLSIQYQPGANTWDRESIGLLSSSEGWIGRYRYAIGPVMTHFQTAPAPPPEMFLDWVLHCANTCRYTHLGCGTYRGIKRQVPRRILEVGESHLVLRLPGDGWQGTYITLSHRWSVPGRPSPPKLHRTNEAEMRSVGIPLSSLPPAFRDAAALARHLDVRYLWIDSLCIFQDSAADWEREAALMGDVYGGGFFSIAVADEESHQEGWIRREQRVLVPVIALPSNPALQNVWGEEGSKTGFEPIMLHDREVFRKYILESMLFTRGWVHQEVMLAPANLFLSQHQAWWYCPQHFCCETYPLGAPSFIITFGLANMRYSAFSPKLTGERSQLVWDSWCFLILAFSRAEFTRWSDRTKALAGVVSVLSSDFGTYYAGLWYMPQNPTCAGYDFISQLLWRRQRSLNSRRRTSTEDDVGDNTKPGSGSVVVPTWSWISCPDSVRYEAFTIPYYCFVRLASPPDIENLDQFGWPRTRETATLHITAVLVPLAPSPQFTLMRTCLAGPLIPADSERTARLASILFDCDEELEEMETQSETSNGSTDGYFFVPFFYVRARGMHGLVVKEQKELSQAKDERRFFRRIGYFAMTNSSPGPNEHRIKYPQETWSYVFGDWDFARLGRTTVRDLGLCDDWMVANEEPDLDDVYLI